MAGFSVPIISVFGIDIVSFLVALGIYFGVYLVITLSLNLEVGYTGIPNFGKLLFVASGSAVAASLSGRFAALIFSVNTRGDYITFNNYIIEAVNKILANSPLLSIGIFLFSLLIGAAVGAAFGYISSFPAIRLREDYLAMLLLAAAQFFTIFLAAYVPLIGGYAPVGSPDPFQWAGTGRGVRDLLALTFIFAVAAAVYLYSERLVRSPLGRTLRAVRDNEVASEAVGKDNVAIRNRILIIASAMCGMAGALWGMYLAANDATIWIRFDWTIIPWVMLILGGAGNNLGAAVGTFTFAAMIRVIGQAKLAFGDIPLPVGLINNAGAWSIQYMTVDVNRIEFIAVGSALVIVLLLRPQGIMAEKATFTLSRSKVAEITTSEGVGPAAPGGRAVPRRIRSLFARARKALSKLSKRVD